MLEGMAGQEGVADLDVDPDLPLQAIAPQEAEDRGDVVIVLVLGRLLRLRLDLSAFPSGKYFYKQSS